MNNSIIGRPGGGAMSDTRKRAVLAVGGFSLGVAGLVLVTLVAAGIGALVWWLGVASSGTAGTGDLAKQRNSAQNIAQWSTTFNGEYQRVQADVANLATLKAAESAPGATQQDRVDYTGAQTVCQQDAAAYNADTKNVLAVVPAGLPAAIPLTTCGE